MDVNDDESEEELFSFHEVKGNMTRCQFRMPVSGIHKAVVERNLHKIKRWIESGESVNKKETHRNFSLLHMIVMCNKLNIKGYFYPHQCIDLQFGTLEILDYLLRTEGIEVDAICSEGRTPLYWATMMGNIELVEKLIQAGSDIHIADNDNDTALHMSVYHPRICRLLLQQGARIHTDDSQGRTLHLAVKNDCLEIVYMLLYYNVDTNVLDSFNRTPFLVALFCRKEEAQEILLEYVDDFNRISYSGGLCFGVPLSCALATKSPFIKDIIERGADVNYDDNLALSGERCAFLTSLRSSVDLSTFKMIWERLRYNGSENNIDLLRFLDYVDTVPTFLQVIIESDNFEPAVQFFSKGENYFLFVNKFAEKKFDLDQLTALTCRLLEFGFRVSSYDIHTIFSHYGYCELFRVLLYMDNDYTLGWLPHMALSRLIFDIHYDLENVVDNINVIPTDSVLELLEYSICPRLIDALVLQYSNDESRRAILDRLPRVPLLMELARNAARKQVWHLFKVINNCQFYTTIDHLDIPPVYKDILTFKRKIYTIKF